MINNWQEQAAKEEGFKSVAEWQAWHERIKREDEQFRRAQCQLEDEEYGDALRRNPRRINRF